MPLGMFASFLLFFPHLKKKIIKSWVSIFPFSVTLSRLPSEVMLLRGGGYLPIYEIAHIPISWENWLDRDCFPCFSLEICNRSIGYKIKIGVLIN